MRYVVCGITTTLTSHTSHLIPHFIMIKDILKTPEKFGIGSQVEVKGWVRTKRGNNAVACIALNDGSIVHNIQVVADLANFPEDLMKQITDRKSVV